MASLSDQFKSGVAAVALSAGLAGGAQAQETPAPAPATLAPVTAMDLCKQVAADGGLTVYPAAQIALGSRGEVGCKASLSGVSQDGKPALTIAQTFNLTNSREQVMYSREVDMAGRRQAMADQRQAVQAQREAERAVRDPLGAVRNQANSVNSAVNAVQNVTNTLKRFGFGR